MEGICQKLWFCIEHPGMPGCQEFWSYGRVLPACRAAGRGSTPGRTASYRVPPPAWPEVAVCASAACWRGHRPSAAPSRAGVPAFSRVGCLLTPTFPGLVLTPVWLSPVGGPGQGEREIESTSYYPRLRGNLEVVLAGLRVLRSIPAPAGEPNCRSRIPDNGGVTTVYPRACGGTAI